MNKEYPNPKLFSIEPQKICTPNNEDVELKIFETFFLTLSYFINDFSSINLYEKMISNAYSKPEENFNSQHGISNQLDLYTKKIAISTIYEFHVFLREMRYQKFFTENKYFLGFLGKFNNDEVSEKLISYSEEIDKGSFLDKMKRLRNNLGFHYQYEKCKDADNFIVHKGFEKFFFDDRGHDGVKDKALFSGDINQELTGLNLFYTNAALSYSINDFFKKESVGKLREIIGGIYEVAGKVLEFYLQERGAKEEKTKE